MTDPDGAVTSPDHAWYRSKVDPPNRNPDVTSEPDFLLTWELIDNATAESYTPVEADVGKYLLVRVDYSDPLNGADDRVVLGISANKVRAEVPDHINTSPDFTDPTTTRTVPETPPSAMPWVTGLWWK